RRFVMQSMKEVVVGGVRYRLVVDMRAGQSVAHAERADTGDRFGIEYNGATERDALERLTRWLEWQSEHMAALEALQRAEQADHHPDILINYKRVTLTYSTHSEGGLTEKDFVGAAAADRAARAR